MLVMTLVGAMMRRRDAIGLRFIFLALLMSVVVVAQERKIELPPTWPADGKVPERLKNQYVFLSPQQDTLIVRMPVDEDNPDGPRRVVRIALHNQLHPSVRATISSPQAALYQYNYTLSNSLNAKDRIGTWALVVPLEDEAFDMSHPDTPQHKGWSGKVRATTVNAPRVGLPGWPLECYARWFRNETSKLATPGNSVSGFEMSSSNKPGLTTAFFASDVPPRFELMKGSPVTIHEQMEFYNKDPAWRDHPRVTVGPRFPASTPAIEIVRDFQAGIERLVTDKRLEAGSPFIKELLKWLSEASREDSPRPFKITTPPTTDFEKEIKAALELSLAK